MSSSKKAPTAGRCPANGRSASPKSISAKGGSDAYTTVKAGSDWELREPVRDRVDPDKIKTILTALPDIWVEKFVEPDKKTLDDFGLKDPAQVLKVTQPGGDVIT